MRIQCSTGMEKLAEHVAETKHHRSLLEDAVRADVAMQASGVGYAIILNLTFQLIPL